MNTIILLLQQYNNKNNSKKKKREQKTNSNILNTKTFVFFFFITKLLQLCHTSAMIHHISRDHHTSINLYGDIIMSSQYHYCKTICFYVQQAQACLRAMKIWCLKGKYFNNLQ